MSQAFAAQCCRIVAPEKLSDRFLMSGILYQKAEPLLEDQVVLAYVLEITKPWFPSSKVFPTILETIQTLHPTFKAGKQLGDQFEELLRTINQHLNTISEEGETDWIGNLNGLLMVIGGSELHFSQTGRCPSYILQNNRIRQITDEVDQEKEPHPLKTFSNLSSGILQENDYILVANRELYNEISLDALRRILNSSSPHQSCLAIAKELKKENNPAVSASIIKVTNTANTVNEPTEVVLEEVMQSNLKRLQNRLLPMGALVKTFSKKAGTAGLEAARQTGAAMKDKVGPKASELLNKTTQQAQNLKDQVANQVMKKEVAPETPGTTPAPETKPAEKETEKAVSPSDSNQKPEDQSAPSPEKVASAPEEAQPKATSTTSPESTPAAANAAEGSAVPTPETSPIPPPPFQKAVLLAKGKQWLTVPRNKKIVAMAIAVALVGGTLWNLYSDRRKTAAVQEGSQNVETLAKITQLKDKIVSAVELKQEVEASRDIEEARKLLTALKDMTEEQKATVSKLWDDITLQADSLTKTTRLAAPARKASFSAEAQGLMVSAPYFFGHANGSAALLRTASGTPAETQKSITLSDPADFIISLAESHEKGAEGYALTFKNKVYRVVQDTETTTLKAVTPAGGEAFVKGDAIGAYLGNLYILDGKTGLLWRYAAAGSNFSKGVSLIDTTKFDIKKGVSLAIDGAIYILKQDGSLMKFLSGKQQDSFGLKGVPELSKKMVRPLQVITDENMQSIFILDAGTTTGDRSTTRVMEFSKAGTFVGQYAFPNEYTDVRGFDINPKDKKLWLLNGNEVSEFDL